MAMYYELVESCPHGPEDKYDIKGKEIFKFLKDGKLYIYCCRCHDSACVCEVKETY